MEAEPYYRRAFAIRLKRHGERHAATARSQMQLAALLGEAGRVEEADRLSARALTTIAQLDGDVSAAHARALISRSNILARAGNGFAAEGGYRQAATIFQRLGAGSALDQAVALNNLGVHLLRLSRGSSAPMWFRRAFGMRQSVMSPIPIAAGGDETPGEISPTLRRQLQFDSAMALRMALRIREARLPPDHPDIANSLNSLAASLSARGDVAGAEPLLRRALAIKEGRLRADDSDLIVGRWALGMAVQRDPARAAEARSLFRGAAAGILAAQGQHLDFSAGASGELRSYAPVFVGQVRVAWALARAR